MLTYRSGRRWSWFTAPAEINAERTAEVATGSEVRFASADDNKGKEKKVNKKRRL